VQLWEGTDSVEFCLDLLEGAYTEESGHKVWRVVEFPTDVQVRSELFTVVM
jgi:hypothetical protein